MTGMLEKMKIIGFLQPKESAIAVPFSIYFAMFNPEKYSITSQTNYNADRVQGGLGEELRYNRTEARTFTFDFLVDGTGASGEKREVLADIILFRATCGFLGEIHQPAYLIINWGTLLIRCKLTSLTIDYTLFRSDGTPLRATLKATFTEYTTPELQQLQAFLSSPDVTHVHTIEDKDRIDNLSNRIYFDSKYYMELARVNNLDQFRKLKEGDKLVFPPVDKTGSEDK